MSSLGGNLDILPRSAEQLDPSLRCLPCGSCPIYLGLGRISAREFAASCRVQTRSIAPAAATMSVDTSSSGTSVVGGAASSETSIAAALVSVASLGGLMGAVVKGLGRKEPEAT